MNLYPNNILEIKDLEFEVGKKERFCLDKISFTVPYGCVMGLIGENGAGKTTLIRLILSMYFPKSGVISLFGTEAARENAAARDKIGFILNENIFPVLLSPYRIGNMLSTIYSNWNEVYFKNCLEKFNIPFRKPLSSFSSGMIVKLQLAAALSHNPELLILDEPMNNLDPVSRRELLNILFDFMKDEKHSILISSHLTDDLEKICDSVTFISKGKLVLSEQMDKINENWGVLKIDEKQFSCLNRSDYIGFQKNKYAYEVLISKKQESKFQGMVCQSAKLEDIMYFYLHQIKEQKNGGLK